MTTVSAQKIEEAQEDILELKARAEGIRRHQQEENELRYTNKQHSVFHQKAANLLAGGDVDKYYRHIQFNRIPGYYSYK